MFEPSKNPDIVCVSDNSTIFICQNKMIDRITIKNIFNKKLNLTVDSITPITTGKFNSSFIVAADGRDYVIRIAPDPNSVFIFYECNMMAQEPQLHKLIREKTDAPVAKIFVYDNTRTLLPTDYLIMERLPGRALSEANISSGNYAKVMLQMGRYIAQVHAITSKKYGYLGEHNCMQPQNNWASAFKIMWNKLIDGICDVSFYSDDEAEMVRGLVDRYYKIFDRPIDSSLLHMDIWPQNILVDRDMNVTGIVDWDRALWGDVEIEYAVLDYCGISEPSFWIGYGKDREQTPQSQLRNIFYLLYEIQKYIIIRAGRQHNRTLAQTYKDQTFALIKKYLR